MIGETIAHYSVTGMLGAGGMGEVYRALDVRLGRELALKVLPSDRFRDSKARARLLREARSAAALNHPNICTIYEVGEDGDRAFIAMELIHGEPLSVRISTGALPAELAGRYGRQIADALSHAHERGIIHRDLKSANVVVTADGRPKVLDFGLAKRLTSEGLDEKTISQTSITASGELVGTLAYMAPEQLRGQPSDARSDIWSLGVMLYEMVVGVRPFQGQTWFTLSSAILNQPAPALSERIPVEIRAVIERCLEKEPSQRYRSSGEVRAALETGPAVAASRSGATRPVIATPEKSIAVLYFENMSSDSEGDYFCAGIADDIITDLSKVQGLKVVPRSDVVPFRKKEVNTREVGQALQVNYILEGSVRKAGNKIRVTAQFIRVHDGLHLWAERFDRSVEDIFEVQNDVSRRVVEALRISLTESEKRSLARNPTDDLKAYDFYMRGRELVSRGGKKNHGDAIRMFEDAVAVDPRFAAAYAGLAEACCSMYQWYDGRSSWLTRAIEMNEEALALDPSSIDVRFGIALVYFYQGRLDESKRQLEGILDDDPEYYPAFLRLGILSEFSKQLEPALAYYSRAAELKPYDETPWRCLVGVHRKLGNQAAAQEAAVKVIEVASKKLEASLDDVTVMSRLAEAYAWYGGREETHATLRRVLELDPGDGLALYNCACAHALLGEAEEAFSLLRRAHASGFRTVGRWAIADTAFESLRRRPEFLAVLSELGSEVEGGSIESLGKDQHAQVRHRAPHPRSRQSVFGGDQSDFRSLLRRSEAARTTDPMDSELRGGQQDLLRLHRPERRGRARARAFGGISRQPDFRGAKNHRPHELRRRLLTAQRGAAGTRRRLEECAGERG